ncbi:TadG family pilus assembly protein [Paraburkholderia flagellata]|uniref:TadG family pilus assembly protein n=1 Tax=Paraburkholderia flagellata TaxID=2883241 RepID=UPI001F42F0F3|nr:TadG family pilus assembly protein [Paraburkholderia flagellata]
MTDDLKNLAMREDYRRWLSELWDVASANPTLVAPGATAPTPTSTYLPEPAVKVTVTRSGTSNTVVKLLLAEFLGVPTANASATSVAVISPPTGVPAGALFPMVMDQCVYNQYWNPATNSPVTSGGCR